MGLRKAFTLGDSESESIYSSPRANSVQTFAEGSIVNMVVDSFVMSGVVMIAATRE